MNNHLKTNRNIWKFLFLNIVTIGVYNIIMLTVLGQELNTIAGPHDGRKTMHFFLMLLLMPFTLGISLLVWMHKFSGRIAIELKRRNAVLPFPFGASTFWLWNLVWTAVFGSVFAMFVFVAVASGGNVNILFFMIILLGISVVVGPHIYIFRLFAAMNTLAADYNTNG